MKRQSLATAAVVVSMVGALGACSGGSDDEPKAAATTKATSAATTTPTATPTAEQPQGADGVTFDVQNWDEYASRPEVLAWKQVQEALAASTNQRKVLPALRQGVNKKTLRKFTAAVDYSAKNEYHTPDRGIARIETLTAKDDAARLTTCLWAPSASVYDKNDKIVGDDGSSQYWYKQQVTMESAAGRWIVTSQLTEGTCPGGPPS